MGFIPYAVLFFLIALVVEWAYGIKTGNNTFRLNDTLNSLTMGFLRNLSKAAPLGLGYWVFANIESSYALPAWDTSNPWSWVIGLLAFDFLYYWKHRISHERQIFWASHVAHHQSEEYNLSTALRQTGTGFIMAWVFFIPLFFLGMPIELYVAVASIDLIYQFWVHTRHVPKLGWLEWFLVTPSNHRVHHAQNPVYIDKNYGGILIIWDRLFGTFVEEKDDEDVIFGLRTPLSSWNPLWANVHVYWGMLQDSIRTKHWRDKLYVWVSRTGWRPEDVSEAYPREKTDLDNIQKYDPNYPASASVAIFMSFVLAAITAFVLETTYGTLSVSSEWVLLSIILHFVVIGDLLEGGRRTALLELCRGALVIWIMTSLGSAWNADIPLAMISVVSLVSFVLNMLALSCYRKEGSVSDGAVTASK